MHIKPTKHDFYKPRRMCLVEKDSISVAEAVDHTYSHIIGMSVIDKALYLTFQY